MTVSAGVFPKRRTGLWSGSFARTAFRFAVGPVILLSVVAVSTILLVNYRGEQRWQQYLHDATARGVQLELGTFVSPPVPAEENFAAIPLFEELFHAQGSSENRFKLPTRGVRPNVGDPVLGQRMDFTKWRDFFIGPEALPEAATNGSSPPAASVLNALQRYEPALEQLRNAAARSRCAFPVDWAFGCAAVQPHLGTLSGANRILGLRISALLAEGRTSAAMNDLRMMLRWQRLLEHEPTLIAGLIRSSCLEAICKTVWQGMAIKGWSEPDLREIEEALAPMDMLAAYDFALASERAAQNRYCDVLVNGSFAQRKKLLAASADSELDKDPLMPWLLRLPGFVRDNEVRNCRHMEELQARIDITKGRIYDDRETPSDPGRLKGTWNEHYYCMFSRSALIYPELEIRFAHTETLRRQARTACALERFRTIRGTYPRTLDQLLPKFLSAAPSEVYSDAEMKYRLETDGGYLLYSVGFDRKDDGGTSVRPGKTGSVSWREQPDWVWRLPAN